ncbi:hypothetical protein A2468_05790 [Candidatus Falkowbacteria bacterium RIFOXYC2_FULL_46_15]|nr:MAG: hypothetical protein A2468_05790 [Candidatus Falkowbacteria bacterium RIFOXYC2_FULL_46_15]
MAGRSRPQIKGILLANRRVFEKSRVPQSGAKTPPDGGAVQASIQDPREGVLLCSPEYYRLKY